jgi:hypothetical protein
MMQIPDNQIEFFLHPAVFTALIIGFSILGLTALLLKFPELRKHFKFLFKIYLAITMVPLYIAAAIIYAISFSKINLFEKFKEIDFIKKYKQIYIEPKEIFEDMRINPTNYHLWIGFYICAVMIALDYLLISSLVFMYYGGRETIIFGLLSSEPPVFNNPVQFWIYRAIIGNIVWIPTKFVIYFLVILLHKYDKTDEPERPWWDKVRLTYIAWGYIIAADAIWCFGMIISLIVSIFIPTWEVLIFTWVCVIICGIIELVYQQYSLHGLFKLGWAKGFLIWGLSMIPFAITGSLIDFTARIIVP